MHLLCFWKFYRDEINTHIYIVCKILTLHLHLLSSSPPLFPLKRAKTSWIFSFYPCELAPPPHPEIKTLFLLFPSLPCSAHTHPLSSFILNPSSYLRKTVLFPLLLIPISSLPSPSLFLQYCFLPCFSKDEVFSLDRLLVPKKRKPSSPKIEPDKVVLILPFPFLLLLFLQKWRRKKVE